MRDIIPTEKATAAAVTNGGISCCPKNNTIWPVRSPIMEVGPVLISRIYQHITFKLSENDIPFEVPIIA